MNRNSFSFACLLNLLAPGCGHAFWREYAFGAFVFLVMILSALLAIVSVLLTLSVWVRIAMFALPVLFYVFTFVDLRRVVRGRKSPSRGHRATMIFVAATIAWQLFSPIAPINFGGRNFPGIFRQSDNSLSPLYHQGDILLSNSLAYRASFFFVSQPQYFALPRTGELVRFVDSSGNQQVGIVAGLPGELIEIDDGKLFVGADWYDLSEFVGFALAGQVELTSVDSGSILVVRIRLGAVDSAEQVSIGSILGRVHKLL